MEPHNWNVVVVGAWNPAILTPKWIGKTIFDLPPGSPIEILVPMDGYGYNRPPFQVQYNGLLVELASTQLVAQVANPSEELLSRAMGGVAAAINSLPITPLAACGINIRFQSPEPPGILMRRTRGESESILSDAGYEIHSRRRGESIAFEGGRINFRADLPTSGPCEITVNFDKTSDSKDDILSWLARPAKDYIAEAQKLITLLAE